MHKKIGDFLVDPSKQVVIKDGIEIDVEPLVFDVLYYLMNHHDRYVSVNELHEEIWINKVVSDSAVRRTIVKLRNLFGDKSYDSQYIKSKARHGYRLICEISDYKPEVVFKDKLHDNNSTTLPNIKLSYIISTFLIIAVIVVSFIYFNLNKKHELPPIPEIKFSSLGKHQLISGQKSYPQLSSSGNYLAFSNKIEKSLSNILFVTDLKTGDTRQVTSTSQSVINPVWIDNDSALVALDVTNGKCLLIKITQPFHDNLREITSLYQCKSGQPNINYSKDENRLIFSDSNIKGSPMSLMGLNLDNLEVTNLTTPLYQGIGDYFSSLSSSGKKLAYIRNENTENFLYIRNSETNALQIKVNLKYDIFGMFWNEFEQIFLFTKGKLLKFDQKGKLLDELAIDPDIVELYLSNTPGEYIAVMQAPTQRILIQFDNPFNQGSSSKKIIVESKYPMSFTYAQSEQDIYYTLKEQGLISLYKSSHQGNKKIITTNKNIRLIGGNSNEKYLIFVEGMKLGIIDLTTQKFNYIFRDNSTINDVFIYPTGKRLLISVQELGNSNLYLFSIDTQREQLMAKNVLRAFDIGSDILGVNGNNDLIKINKQSLSVSSLDESVNIDVNNSWKLHQKTLYYSLQNQEHIELRSFNIDHNIKQQVTVDVGSYNGHFDMNISGDKLIHNYIPFTTNKVRILKTNF